MKYLKEENHPNIKKYLKVLENFFVPKINKNNIFIENKKYK